MAQYSPIYEFSVAIYTTTLNNLLHCMDIAEEHAKANNERVDDYCELRLSPDMAPFTYQIQSVSDNAKGAMARLAGHDTKQYSMPDNEKTWAECRARLQKTLEFLAAAKPDDYIGREAEIVTLRDPPISFSALTSQQVYGLPNFFFHVTTAYCLLRMKGVPVGKMDYLAGKDGVKGWN